VWIAIALVLGVIWRRPGILLEVIAAVLASELLSYGLRQSIGRARPPLTYARPKALVSVPHSGSFPSGHTTTAFACAAVLAWAVPRLAVPFFVLAAAIGFSRIYVGVHYPLDVVGGAALGLAIATALRWLVTALRRSPRAPRAS
jgi:undecaprenyl-diphosphatase